MIRQDEWDRILIVEFTNVVSSIKKLAQISQVKPSVSL